MLRLVSGTLLSFVSQVERMVQRVPKAKDVGIDCARRVSNYLGQRTQLYSRVSGSKLPLYSM